jgi:Arc-like DNA binding dprotein
MMQKQEYASVLVRLPKTMKAWIEQEAQRNGASQNSEIVRSIRARMDGDHKVSH